MNTHSCTQHLARMHVGVYLSCTSTRARAGVEAVAVVGITSPAHNYRYGAVAEAKNWNWPLEW